ncbi:hypothetical protein [Fictibacillus barbaricus]|uniref:DUF4468 domain-containing protein n=1 Tax=Fictibacillus barbaricus TaxID=182136 RepID=A0ABS2ZMZ2_9BACL|nr:hypothetical protein [Fictibacillus barbaricus]MBN3547976.1 hypothetical protein [Fictibacillus barbaricus]GGB53009.1 hypothetical protein GCM10007199_18610 [Fictibacillus barbaricus]
MKLDSVVYILFLVFIISSCHNSSEKLIDGKVQISEEIDNMISEYIIQNSSKAYANTDKKFEVHRIYGTSEKNGVISVYLHSYFGGFNKKSGNSMQGGHSLPALMKIKKDSSGYSVVDYQEPKDGDLYKPSLEKMFPERYSKMELQRTGNIKDLEKEMDEKVNRWLNQ